MKLDLNKEWFEKNIHQESEEFGASNPIHLVQIPDSIVVQLGHKDESKRSL